MAKMIKYYNFSCRVTRHTAWACTETEDRPLGRELVPYVVEHNSLGFPLFLKKVTLKNSTSSTSDDLSDMKYLWPDLIANDFAFNMLSVKLREVVANHLTGEEGIVWVPVQVIGPEEERTYYIPRFTKELDTLDEEKTEHSILKYEGKEYKSVMIPYYSSKKIQNYAMFYYPSNYWQLATGLYVNSELMLAIRKAKLTGIAFEDVRVSYD